MSLILANWSYVADILWGPATHSPLVIRATYSRRQGSPTPRLQTGTSPWPVRNWAAQQEVGSRRVREASSAALHRSPSLALLTEPLLALPPEPSPPTPAIRGKIVFHKTSPWYHKGWGLLL